MGEKAAVGRRVEERKLSETFCLTGLEQTSWPGLLEIFGVRRSEGEETRAWRLQAKGPESGAW